MSRNSPALGPILGKNEQATHLHCIPAELPGNGWHQTYLLVVFPEGPLDGSQLGLDLDNQERAGWLMPCQQVDRAALTPLRVRNFGPGLPLKTAQPIGAAAHQGGMALVEHSIRIGAEPSNAGIEAQSHCADDAANRANPK